MSEPNRAGMIAFNLAGQVLIVSALTAPDKWVFPKGHIEKQDESLQKAAEREVLEETGVIATALYKVGVQSYQYKNETVTVEWWAGCAVRKAVTSSPSDWAESDFREARWVSVTEAMELLSFDNLKTMLKKAVCLE